jgi:poly(3-hydroxybutyrate) depolymerase
MKEYFTFAKITLMKAVVPVAVLTVISTGISIAQAASPLPSLKIDTKNITVSGLSAGGFMAVQLGVAYSAQIRGVGVVAGGLYRCAEGDAQKAKDICMAQPQSLDVKHFVEDVHRAESAKLIDPVANMSAQRIFVLHGTRDTTVNPASAQKLTEFYQGLGVPVESLLTLPMGHGLPTKTGRVACAQSQLPWMNNCDSFDGPRTILQKIAGAEVAAGQARDGSLVEFEQTSFGANGAALLPAGYVYIPESCQRGGCGLHIALHGCLQNTLIVQKEFVAHAGYNDVAETNGLIILYPQASSGAGNPYGCWDWFGYTRSDYAYKSGPQMSAIMSMVETLAK